MDLWMHLPLACWILWVFMLGLGIGSFLNVLIVRLPYEKSVIWPGSHCGACYRSLRLLDNLPIIGYLRLRGRCRFCGTSFSSRYLWVEVGTGVAFVLLYIFEIVIYSTGGPDIFQPWQNTPGLKHTYFSGSDPVPPLKTWLHWAVHAYLLASLIACALIDLNYRIIPGQITYVGTIIGILCSTLFPWPWPTTDPMQLAKIGTQASWMLPESGAVLTGTTLWPVWGPLPSWLPAGSPQLGFVNGVVGAAAGMFAGRSVKFLFEIGFGREALGLGDADLMMMAGAFLGWQIAVLALPAGALMLLPIIIPIKIYEKLRGRSTGNELPFGPGIALGIVACWWCWPWLGELVRVAFFDKILLTFVVVIVGGGLLIMGLILRKGPLPPDPTPTAK